MLLQDEEPERLESNAGEALRAHIYGNPSSAFFDYLHTNVND
jgi:hypothetical protein